MSNWATYQKHVNQSLAEAIARLNSGPEPFVLPDLATVKNKTMVRINETATYLVVGSAIDLLFNHNPNYSTCLKYIRCLGENAARA